MSRYHIIKHDYWWLILDITTGLRYGPAPIGFCRKREARRVAKAWITGGLEPPAGLRYWRDQP